MTHHIMITTCIKLAAHYPKFLKKWVDVGWQGYCLSAAICKHKIAVTRMFFYRLEIKVTQRHAYTVTGQYYMKYYVTYHIP